jgi:agmatine deiminase
VFSLQVGNPALMKISRRRLPAEWEWQDAVMLAWPHDRSDWNPVLAEARRTFSEIVETVERFEPVLLVRPDRFDIPTDDTWARDFGPITIEEDGKPILLDFTFNGWGGKFPAERDNAITRRLHRMQAFGRLH